MTTKVTESIHPGEFILSEAEGSRSREAVTIKSGQNLPAGRVVGKATVSLTVGAPTHSGTGAGAITMGGTTPVLAGAIPGVYLATCTHADTDAGVFEVTDPNGKSLGSVKVGNTFANQIKFVIADGTPDHAVGSQFQITIAAGTGKYAQVPKTAALDGTDTAAGVLLAAVDASGGDAPGVIIARDAEVDGNLISYETTSMGTLGNTQLGTLGVIVRI